MSSVSQLRDMKCPEKKLGTHQFQAGWTGGMGSALLMWSRHTSVPKTERNKGVHSSVLLLLNKTLWGTADLAARVGLLTGQCAADHGHCQRQY